jgi:hypothetical protein
VPGSRNQSTGQSAVSFNTVGLVSVTIASTSYIGMPFCCLVIKMDSLRQVEGQPSHRDNVVKATPHETSGSHGGRIRIGSVLGALPNAGGARLCGNLEQTEPASKLHGGDQSRHPHLSKRQFAKFAEYLGSAAAHDAHQIRV